MQAPSIWCLQHLQLVASRADEGREVHGGSHTEGSADQAQKGRTIVHRPELRHVFTRKTEANSHLWEGRKKKQI